MTPTYLDVDDGSVMYLVQHQTLDPIVVRVESTQLEMNLSCFLAIIDVSYNGRMVFFVYSMHI